MVRHTRYPAGKDWLPEAFKQEAASSTEYPHRQNTEAEQVAMIIRNYVMRRTSYATMIKGLYDLKRAISVDIVDAIIAHKDGEELREALRPFSGRVYE